MHAFDFITPELRSRYEETYGSVYPCACGRMATRTWYRVCYLDDGKGYELEPVTATCEIPAHFPEGSHGARLI